MKVRAIEGYPRKLTVGKIYDVVSKSDCGTSWRVVDDSGNTDGFVWSHYFEVVEEEPKIEVGSLWIHDNGLEIEVTAVGETKALVKYEAGEYPCGFKDFGTIFKPKPKIVTMYFYKSDNGHISAADTDNYAWGDPLFTREIELP